MKKILPFLLFGILAATSCKQEETNNNETSVHARADSTVGIRMTEINQRAMEDLDKRMAIEVKAKADSIVAVANGTYKPATTNVAVPDERMMDTSGDKRARRGLKRIYNDSARIR